MRKPLLLTVAWCVAAPAIYTGPALSRLHADVVEISTGVDNTLFRYLPANYTANQNTWLKSNGEGNFFSAGRTNARDEIQRGLLWFDLAGAAVPAGAVVQSVSLRLYVIDVPQQAHPLPDVWLVALPALAQTWGEGASSANMPISGAGRGANAQAGDATWFHTQYDPADPAHYDAASLPASPWTYRAGQPGFWSDAPMTTPAGLAFPGGPGALGDAPVTLPGWYAPAGVDVRNDLGFVTWSTPQMALDVQAWLDDPSANFGWIMLGIEDALSKRSFASFEHPGDPFTGEPWRPTLTIEYSLGASVVPEPGTLALGLLGAGMLVACGLARARRRLWPRPPESAIILVHGRRPRAGPTTLERKESGRWFLLYFPATGAWRALAAWGSAPTPRRRSPRGS